MQAAAISGAGLGAFLRLIPFILCSHADFPQRSTKFVSDFQPPILAGPQLPIDVFDRLSRDFRCFGPSSVLIWEFFPCSSKCCSEPCRMLKKYRGNFHLHNHGDKKYMTVAEVPEVPLFARMILQRLA